MGEAAAPPLESTLECNFAAASFASWIQRRSIVPLVCRVKLATCVGDGHTNRKVQQGSAKAA